MKFSENWLRTLVDPPYSSDELAHSLTMAGLEIEAVEPVTSSTFDKVVVAEVISVEKHPSADRLNICRVDIGAVGEEALQIVCGAPNVSVGVKVPCALIGAKLTDFVIKKAKLRGVESSGMLCSAKELGLSDETEGLLLLPNDAPTGADFRGYYELNDKIFILKLTPNRADCLGLFGVAREVAAITSTDYDPFDIEPIHNDVDDLLAVHVAEVEACPLYCGRVMRDVNLNVATPSWITRRLERSGVRAINVVVDITNYVMLEMGQPMHAFNLEKIMGAIEVRYARLDEKITLLNGEEINLETNMLLIADESKPLALAGIMGGSDSSVEHDTTDIFLESAFFHPNVISGKSFHLGFNSDSAHRFERGVDFAVTRNTLERASGLILSVCGGNIGPVTEVKNKLPQRAAVKVRIDRIKRVLGIDIDVHCVTDFFTRLRFDFSVDGNIFYVTPPTYRFDLEIEEDLIEEIARLYGYDSIPANSPRTNLAMLSVSETNRPDQELKKILTIRDYQEVINYAFVDAAWEANLFDNQTPITLKNPIASQMNVMRSSLIGGLLSNLQFNLNRKQTRVRLFEMGCCFVRNDQNNCLQIENLAGLCYGDLVSEQWGEAARSIDFYDAKADVEALFYPKTIDFKVASRPALHPGKCAQIFCENKCVGWMGELHPRWQKKYALVKPVILFELQLDALITKSIRTIKKISKFPIVRRDIAVLIENHISAHTLLASMIGENLAIISEIALFDIYHGEGIGDSKKSLAFRVLLQDTEKTLTDEEADSAVLYLVAMLEQKFGAELRN